MLYHYSTSYRIKLKEKLTSYKSLIESTKEYQDISKYGVNSYKYLKSHNNLNYTELAHLNRNIKKSIVLIDKTYYSSKK